jgi:hypothetical protein
LPPAEREGKIEAMPFYRFMVHGRDPDAEPGRRGFYTNRHAFAATESQAAAKVLDRLRHEFTAGASAPLWRSGAPIMSIEDACRVRLRELRSVPNTGSTFYEDNESGEAGLEKGR